MHYVSKNAARRGYAAAYAPATLDPGAASAMIEHATRVALRWNRALELAGMDY